MSFSGKFIQHSTCYGIWYVWFRSDTKFNNVPTNIREVQHLQNGTSLTTLFEIAF